MLLAETDAQQLKAVLSELLGDHVTSVEGLGGGRNNRVFKVNCGASHRFVAKFYPNEGSVDRNALDAEFTSLTFLWDNQVRCIPRPIVAGKPHQCAIYEYIDGRMIPAQEVGTEEIDQVVRFLTLLKELRNTPGSADIPPASDACFSVQAILTGIDARLNRLLAVRNAGSQYIDLRNFLESEFLPCLTTMKERCEAQHEGCPESIHSELQSRERTLSPSDFGFHNALKRPDGQIVFLDFEYFGWDDPAKTISDFLLHPAMDLNRDLKQHFLSNSLHCFADHPGVSNRVDLIYPLCGLKWCLLLLNEFVPEYLQKRRFAKGEPLDNPGLQSEQLKRARQMLHRVQNSHEPPY